MIRDTPLKETIFRHFWKQRCFVQPEVDVYFAHGATGSKKTITDVDVYVLRPSTTLSFERILADCRTLKGQSPINRALWLSGLLRFFGGQSGCVLLDIPAIEPDHKLAASSVGVFLLNRKDFAIYDKSINFPDGSASLDVHLEDFSRLRGIGKKFPKLEHLTTFLYRDAWRENSFGGLIRHAIAQLKSVAQELDPAKVEHMALVCDASAVFAVGVAECCGTLFHQYLHPAEKELLSESLKVLIWGGREQYELTSTLRKKLLEARRGNSEGSESLELPEWNSFIQLSRNILERPGAAFCAPWFLRQLAFDVLRERKFSASLTEDDLLAAKYSMLIVEYVCRAAGLPRAFQEHLVGRIVRIQSELAVSRDKNRKSHDDVSPVIEAPRKPEPSQNEINSQVPKQTSAIEAEKQREFFGFER